MGQVSTFGRRNENLRAGVSVEWVTIAWMVIEIGVSIGTALASGSVALMAFGLDSGIELISAGVLLWRLGLERRGGKEERIERAEQRAAGIVGWTLMLLALYVVASAGWSLLHHSASSTSPWGIAIAVGAVVVMPILVIVKRRVAARIGSAALKADAAEGIVCTYMAVVLLVGLLVRALTGWWWVDPLAALGIVYFIVSEGQEAIEASRGGETHFSDD